MRSRQAPPLLTSVAIVLLLSAPAALATTWYVDCASPSLAEAGADPLLPFKRIGSALANASPGDTVQVQGRTSCDYPEAVFIQSGVRVVGLPDEIQMPPRITGTRRSSTVSIFSSDPNTLLEGFWVSGGQSIGGAGIFVSGNATVRKNMVSGNVAVGGLGIAEGAHGGGIAVSGDAVIEENDIWGNTAVSGRGGGVAILAGSPAVTRNTIHGNRALVASDGFYGYGGGIALFPSVIEPSVTSNIVRGNRADRSGGGIDAYLGAGVVAGNTIVDNEAGLPNKPGSGGGIQITGNALNSAATLFVMNNVVLGNRSTTRAGGVDLLNSLLNGTLVLRGNNIFNNHPANTNDGALIGTLGNVSVDPALSPGTFAPLDGFPHIDTGRGPILCVGNADEPACLSPAGDTVVRTLEYGTHDIFGRPRLLDGNGDGVARPDVGAAEYSPGPAGDADNDGVADAVDVCPAVRDPLQQDLDMDGVGDACDNCPPADPNDPAASANADQDDLDRDAVGDLCDVDVDNDAVREEAVAGDVPCVGGATTGCDDNCPGTTDPTQADTDRDGVGDVCDLCFAVYNPSNADQDGDRFGDACDNCPTVPNGNCLAGGAECDIDGDGSASTLEQRLGFQSDEDDDGTGDACEDDLDGDGVSCTRDPADLGRCLDPCTGGATAGCGDNCPDEANATQADQDGDTVGDGCDNCVSVPNQDQTDTEGDGTGDVCDADDDGDGVREDGDDSGVAGDNPCPGPDPNAPATGCDDNCPLAGNSFQTDSDGDGTGDACDTETDGDGILSDGDSSGLATDNRCAGVQDPDYPLCDDNCPFAYNPDQSDADADLVGDACDNCPGPNSFQEDLDFDDIGDACDADDDADGVNEDGDGSGVAGDNPCPGPDPNAPGAGCDDNCPTTYNATQTDGDGDGLGDACDGCPQGAGTQDNDGDGLADACDVDDDNDTVIDTKDNCPLVPNGAQTDTDRDRTGDACDPDADGDGVPEAAAPFDNCPLAPNPGQDDLDGDGTGDACDNCPALPGASFTDADLDGAGDVCDNCPGVRNRDQADADGDLTGDACDLCPDDAGPADTDADGDGVPDLCDNCTAARNPDQKDTDEDGIGNVCDQETLAIERLAIAGRSRTGLRWSVVLRNKRSVPVTVTYTLAVRDASGTTVFETTPGLVIPARKSVRDTFTPPPALRGATRTLLVDIVADGETNHTRLARLLPRGL